MLDLLQDASLQPQQRLRANRRLRYASSPIRAIAPVQRTGEQHQDMEICNPCPPTFLLPISPAGQLMRPIHSLLDNSWRSNVALKAVTIPEYASPTFRATFFEAKFSGAIADASRDKPSSRNPKSLIAFAHSVA